MSLNPTKLIRQIKEDMDQLAHDVMRTPPSNYEEFMKLVGRYQEKAALITTVQDAAKPTEGDSDE